MRKYLAVLCTCVLAGCGAYIARGTVDYNQAIEQETNDLLVINILRARDGVPTYYSDISQVRGSMSLGFQEPTLLPIGPIGRSMTRATTTAQPSLQVSPSFDVAPLNTQEFTQGITEPLQLKILQYYIDRGVPASVLIFLMIDKIEVYHTAANGASTVVERYYNTPCSDQYTDKCSTASYNTNRGYGVDIRFYDKIRPWLSYLILNSYTRLEPYGPPTKKVEVGRPGGGPAGSGAGGASSGPPMTLRPVGGGKYQYFTSRDEIALCVPVPTAKIDPKLTPSVRVKIEPSPFIGAPPGLFNEAPGVPHYFEIVSVPHTTVAGSPQAISSVFDPDACVRNLVYTKPNGPDEASPRPATAEHTVVYLRSVDSIVTYLGELLRIRDPAHRPLPFDISTRPSADDRFAVSYNGRTYYVASRGHRIGAARDDRTLEILTLLNQLINLNKKANELPSTRAVQAVP